MDAYIDYSNFYSFFSQCKRRDFSEYEVFFKTKFNHKFTFPKERIDKEPNILIRKKFKDWVKGRNGTTIEYGVDYPTRPINEEEFFHADLRKLSSVYMLSNPDSNILCGKGLLVANEGEELDVLRDLGLTRLTDNGRIFESTKRYDFKKEKEESWEYIANNVSPCTDIVIVDRYIFLPKDGLATDEFYENNICNLLIKLTARTKNIPVNIVFFAYTWSETTTVPIYKIVSKLKSTLAKTIGVEPNITIVNAGSEEHDRYIFTNYKAISSGDSFAYYGRDRSMKTKGRWGYVTSLAADEEFQTNCGAIEDLQALVDYPDTIIMGDCVSNFLILGNNPAPMPGTPIRLQRLQSEKGTIVFNGNAITNNYYWLRRLTNEELEKKNVMITKTRFNTRGYQNRFTYFIEIEEIK